MKIGLLLIFALILLSGTSYLSYRNISSIVSSLQIELAPELKLLSIRDISRDLETADKSIRIYTISREISDLSDYYSIIEGIDDKVNNLKLECSDDQILSAQIDTISNLIEENIIIWNELLLLADNNDVIESLKRLSDQINESQEISEKRGILKRVFNRTRENILSEKEIGDSIQYIENQERITNEKLIAREVQLATTSGRIKEKFYDLITRMEDQVSMLIRERVSSANNLAEKTYTWLVVFSVSSGILAILILYIIIRYIKNAQAYQNALKKSKSEAENLALTKELFMANMSHEIRTPVTAISGFTEQLLNETSDGNALRSLRIIKSSSDHLTKIIDDILDLSKLQNGKLVLEEVHFSIFRVLHEVRTTFELQAGQKNITLDFKIKSGTPPVLFGDPYRLKQILMNLVGNSVKFTENGSVSFSAEGKEYDSGRVDLVLEVNDTGIGIEEDKLEMIFEDFTQAETDTARKYGGTGLGLSIVKKLIDLHGGKIECESKKNQGTSITCHIPLRIGTETLISRDINLPLTIPSEIQNLNILIVDDEEYNRLLFKKILERWKIKCNDVSSGMDAIEILREHRYDVLFMDIRMPGMDGISTTQFIRNELKIPGEEMQVILISAVSFGDDREKYKKEGVNGFIRKPFTEEGLLLCLISVRENIPEPVTENYIEEHNDKKSVNEKINLKNLYHISGGDNQFIKEMLISFNDTTKRGLTEIRKAATDGNWESVSDLAHKMIPPCRHIGAVNLYKLLMEIEDCITRKSVTDSIGKLTNESLAEFEEVSAILNEYIAKLK